MNRSTYWYSSFLPRYLAAKDWAVIVPFARGIASAYIAVSAKIKIIIVAQSTSFN